MAEPRRKAKSPTARTLEALRRRGWPAQVVEKWLPGRRAKKGGRPGETEATPYGVRKDLFGCIDILALDGRPGSLGIQACASGDAAKRAAKAAEEPLLAAWLVAGNRFEVWAWREVWVDTSARTKRRQWEARVVEIRPDMLVSHTEVPGAEPAEIEWCEKDQWSEPVAQGLPFERSE